MWRRQSAVDRGQSLCVRWRSHRCSCWKGAQERRRWKLGPCARRTGKNLLCRRTLPGPHHPEFRRPTQQVLKTPQRLLSRNVSCASVREDAHCFRMTRLVSGGRACFGRARLLPSRNPPFPLVCNLALRIFRRDIGAVATAAPHRVAPFTRLFASGRPPILCGVHQSSHVAPGE
jgi:hypothetical protein